MVTLIKYICLSFHGFLPGDQPKITGSSQPGALCSYMFMNKIKRLISFLDSGALRSLVARLGDELGFTLFLLKLRSCTFPQLLLLLLFPAARLLPIRLQSILNFCCIIFF